MWIRSFLHDKTETTCIFVNQRAAQLSTDLRIFSSPYAAAARIASHRSTRIRLLALGKEISVLLVVNRATDTLVGPQ